MVDFTRLMLFTLISLQDNLHTFFTSHHDAHGKQSTGYHQQQVMGTKEQFQKEAV